MASFCNDTTSLCSGYVPFKKAFCEYFIYKDMHFYFPFSCSPRFTSKASIFLDDRLYQKYRAAVKDF